MAQEAGEDATGLLEASADPNVGGPELTAGVADEAGEEGTGLVAVRATGDVSCFRVGGRGCTGGMAENASDSGTPEVAPAGSSRSGQSVGGPRCTGGMAEKAGGDVTGLVSGSAGSGDRGCLVVQCRWSGLYW